MAEALVGGAFLSGFINVMFDRFLSPEAANMIIGKKLRPELVQRLRTAMGAAKSLLVDAEHKQFGDPDVKDWLDSLMDVVYSADDLLDNVFTKTVTQKEVSSFLPRLFNNPQDMEVVNKIEGVITMIEDLLKHKDILGLKEVVRDKSYSSWRTSTSLVKGDVYGRENDQDAIIKMIDDGSEHQLSVIPIVGMGGVGKTTLAQWLYSSEDLMKGFDLKAWVCVSEEFDGVKIMQTILGGANSSTDLNSLQLDLKQKLSKKKFFIVLDDVWSDDGDIWNNFKTPFKHGAKGSLILITTRSKVVASSVQTCAPYFLNELSDDYCWSVFASNARFPESNGNSALEDIGRMIVKKCNGLPLAAETLGRLCQLRDVNKWKSVLSSHIWEFPTRDSKIIPALLISYYHLPTYLKRCFVYCSLFPKDYRFKKDELVLLWMAEDLLRPSKRGQTLEEVGSECFEDLASRSFFNKYEKYRGESFVMHDLLHDLAMFLAKGFYCRLEEHGKTEADMSIKTRHLSFGWLSDPMSIHLDFVDKVESLRTFLPIVPPFGFSVNMKSTTHVIVLSKLKYLRVLSFHSFAGFHALPNSIGELIHLRYLDLSETSIKKLPDSLCVLYNLQTLRLRNCGFLVQLPDGMCYLLNLRYIDISGTPIREMPRAMRKLKNLQFLSCYVVGKHKDNGIKELGELSNLHGSFQISGLENVANSDEAMGARITDKIHIDKLSLSWPLLSHMISDTKAERDILGSLRPRNGLKVLTIQGYMGTRFPSWVGNSSYYNMTRMTLTSCRNCCMIPSLGQLPNLMSLRIKGFDVLGRIGDEFYKNEDGNSSYATTPFPSLVHLEFNDMPCLEVWCSSNYSIAFPRLKTLVLICCPMLKGDLPNHLRALKTLEIHTCQRLFLSLSRNSKIRRLEIYKSDELRLQELPPSPEELLIEGCQPIESMFQAMTINHLNCLKKLRISNCSSAISFPGDCLPISLETLEINDCKKLEFPKQLQQRHKLRNLELNNSCDSLISFPLEVFQNINYLTIIECENLESLPSSQSQCIALQTLTIIGCPNFVLSMEGLDAPNMTHFEVISCKKLKWLPGHMNNLLPSLEHLQVWDCPEVDGFSDGGLPPNLKSLHVNNFQKLLSSLSSMAPELESLTDLYLGGGDCESMKSFPKHGLLPQLPSLQLLALSGFSSMEILDCNELLHLTFLQTLEIRGCPKLENMDGERLPSSLSRLYIDNSCLLAEHCMKKHPQIWPKISHIPNIEVGLSRVQ